MFWLTQSGAHIAIYVPSCCCFHTSSPFFIYCMEVERSFFACSSVRIVHYILTPLELDEEETIKKTKQEPVKTFTIVNLNLFGETEHKRGCMVSKSLAMA